MKLPLTYGFGIALAGMLVVFLQFFLGYHTELEKFGDGQTVSMISGPLITIVGLILVMRAAREASPDRGLSYGRAVGIGVLTTLFAGLFGAVLMAVYGFIINPEFHDLLYRSQVAQMEEKGVSPERIESSAGMMRFFTGPIWMALAQLIFSPLFGAVLSLILAIFLKRPAVPPAPPATA